MSKININRIDIRKTDTEELKQIITYLEKGEDINHVPQLMKGEFRGYISADDPKRKEETLISTKFPFPVFLNLDVLVDKHPERLNMGDHFEVIGDAIVKIGKKLTELKPEINAYFTSFEMPGYVVFRRHRVGHEIKHDEVYQRDSAYKETMKTLINFGGK